MEKGRGSGRAAGSTPDIDGRPVLRFERQLAHPPAKVWKAITDPAEMAHWFPAAVDFPGAVDTELKPGATMRFTFPDAAPLDTTGEGEILEFDPPKVYAFRWNTDVLRFELVPDGSGCRLVFSQTLGGGWVGRLAAGRSPHSGRPRWPRGMCTSNCSSPPHTGRSAARGRRSAPRNSGSDTPSGSADPRQPGRRGSGRPPSTGVAGNSPVTTRSTARTGDLR